MQKYVKDTLLAEYVKWPWDVATYDTFSTVHALCYGFAFVDVDYKMFSYTFCFAQLELILYVKYIVSGLFCEALELDSAVLIARHCLFKTLF